MSCYDLNNPKTLYQFYRHELIENIANFWLKNAIDNEYGGYFTILERDGTPHGTCKYMWPQGRGAYMFSKLFNVVESREEWLKAAEVGIHFIDAFAFDPDGWSYYKVKRDGTPLHGCPSQPFNELFIALAFAEYAKASKESYYLDRAEHIFKSFIDKNQSGFYEQYSFTKNSIYKEHAIPMIALNVAQEIRDITQNQYYEDFIKQWVDDELFTYADDEYEVLFERVGLNGSPNLDEPEGRSITPGHSMESAWFCMREGLLKKSNRIIRRSAQIVDWTMKIGWDHEYGGLFNFLDIKNLSPGHHDEGWGEDQDWDEKIFWVHAEALCASLYAYYGTKDKKFMRHYQKLHEWSFTHFPDSEYGEWFGYLRRDGSISQTMKGAVKGFFHIPRAFLQCMILSEKMMNDERSICPKE